MTVYGTVNLNAPSFISGGAHTFFGEVLANDNFTLSGGLLAGPAPIYLNDRFFWLGGIIQITGNMYAYSGITIDSPSRKEIARTTLYNFQDAHWLAGDISGSSGAQIINAPPDTASFTINFTSVAYDFLYTGGIRPTFVNNATFEKLDSYGTADLQLSFQNNLNASLNVRDGALALSGGGYNMGLIEFGATATLTLGGTFPLNSGSIFQGSGNAILDGEIDVTCTFNVTGSTRVTNGSTDFKVGCNLVDFGNPLRVSGGYV